MNYAIYEISTGEIISVQDKTVLADGQGFMSLDEIPLEYVWLYYIVDDEAVLRPVSSCQLVGNTITFTNTHPEAVGTITNVDGETIEFTPQDIALTDRGTYYISVRQPFPYSPIIEEITYA